MNITNPIQISERALQEIENIIAEKKIPNQYSLRVGLKGANCGASYLIGFDHQLATDDAYQIENIKVIIDRKHLLHLVGIEIDFEAGNAGNGFTFHKN